MVRPPNYFSVNQCARFMSNPGPSHIAAAKRVLRYLAGMYNRAKHIDTRIYRIRELCSGESPEVDVYKIAGQDQPADIFTKGLPRDAFERHRLTLMGEAP